MKKLLANAEHAGDGGSIPGLGRSPGRGNGNPFQYSCLGNPMDRGAWWTTVHKGPENPTRLSTSAQLKKKKKLEIAFLD